MSDDKNTKDSFDQFQELAVEQFANVAQLAAEARRLGLIPEIPAGLLEKLDLGGTMMDLWRLQLKHATALAGILGPQGRNLEKLNQLSALMARTKSTRTAPDLKEVVNGEDVSFEFTIDNPVSRPQKVNIELKTLRCVDDEKGAEYAFAKEPGLEVKEKEKEKAKERRWKLVPHVERIEPNEIRSFNVQIPPTDLPPGSYEVTAVLALRPLGSVSRHQLRFRVPQTLETSRDPRGSRRKRANDGGSRKQ